MTEVNEVSLTGGGKMAEEGGGGIGRLIKIIIIALVVLALFGGGVFAVYYFLLAADDGAVTGAMAPAATAQGPEPLAKPVFLPLGTFIVNLADGRRYLKTTLELMLSEEAARVYLDSRIAEVKDVVIAELQVLSTEQLRDPNERQQLKQRLLRKVESLLPNKNAEWDDPRPIKKVLITEFYLQ